jgi:hypothetical protein
VRSGVEPFVSQQDLNDADIDLLFQQMSRERMATIPTSE